MHRIQLDIAMAGQQVFLGLDEARLEAPLPDCATALVKTVHILRVAPSEGLHQPGDSIGVQWCEQQMHMIGHRHIRVNGAAIFLRTQPQPVQIEPVILFRKEACARLCPRCTMCCG